jgi:hypothetical protein
MAAAGTGTALHQPVYGQTQAPSLNVAGANDRVVLGIIGTGKQGKNHIGRLQKSASSNNLRIGAVCDVYEKHLRGALKASGLEGEHGYREHERLLERPDLDAVLIATVDNWHGQITLDALDAGKHVYCEKPMTRYLQEGWEVYDKVRSSGHRAPIAAITPRTVNGRLLSTTRQPPRTWTGTDGWVERRRSPGRRSTISRGTSIMPTIPESSATC